MHKMIDLQEHCYLLSSVVRELPVALHFGDGKGSKWLHAGDWLLIASGIEKVEINTTRFDETVAYCSGAWEYESKRSILMTTVGAQLTTFNFVWGGFEAIVKTIDPPNVPSEIKKRASRIDDAIFYLKNEYEPRSRVPLYDEVLAQMQAVLRSHSDYGDLEKEFEVQPFMSESGLGAHIVRIIRNDFAHGSARLPRPVGWDSNDLLESEWPYPELIRLSSRMLLLTVQMLLLAHLKGRHLTVCCLTNEVGDQYIEDVDVVLRALHLNEHLRQSPV